MEKNLFKYVADLINGKHEQEEKAIPGKKENVSCKNSINKKSKLTSALISTLKSNYSGQHVSFEKKALIIWINDNLFYNAIVESDFKEEIITSLNIELGYSFGAVEFKQGKAPEELGLKEIIPNVSPQISNLNEISVIRTAKICPVEGKGSTIDAYYILDADEIKKMPNARYNIGIGKHPKMSDNSYRDNYIAIDDNQLSPEFSKNRYVSRSHAYITFSEEYGFLLHVEYEGTRMAQKRTSIYRGSENIEMNNMLIPEPLKDGDYIVLSKNVHLLFKKN